MTCNNVRNKLEVCVPVTQFLLFSLVITDLEGIYGMLPALSGYLPGELTSKNMY